VKTAIIAGNVEAAKQPAEWLASHEPAADLPGDWEPFVNEMQAAAAEAAAATDVSTAAAAVGQMALSCGACHSALGQGTQFAFMPQPEEAGVQGHMARHAWALERMWRGLVGPSVESWMEGVGGLAESPLQGGTDDTRALGLRVHELGAQGGEAADPAARAAIYAELLTTCAGCHTAAGQGPSATRQTAGEH
jgi:cytochrome c553